MKPFSFFLLIVISLLTGNSAFATPATLTLERQINDATVEKAPLMGDGTAPPRPRHIATLEADTPYKWGEVVNHYAYLYISGYEYLHIFDITNLNYPVYVDSAYINELVNVPISASVADESNIYLAASETVYVLDITTSEPVLTETYTELPSRITAIATDNQWLYVVGTTSTGGATPYTLTSIHPTKGITTTLLGEHDTCPALQVAASVMAIHCDSTTTLYHLDEPAQPTPYATAERVENPTACVPLHLAPPYLYLDNHLYSTNLNGVLQPLHTIPDSDPPHIYTALAPWGDYLLRVDTVNGSHRGSLVDIQEPTTALPIGNPFLLESRGCGENLHSDGNRLYTLTETGFDLWQLDFDYVQYLPLMETLQPFDSSLKDEVGLFVRYTPGVIGRQIFTLRLDGTRPQLIYDSGPVGYLSTPVWSPDGTRLFFVKSENNQDFPYLLNIDGTELTPLFPNGSMRDAQWSPDSQRLLFRNIEGGGVDVLDTLTMRTYDVRGTEDNTIFNIEWSPDSQTIAYTKDVDPDSNTRLIHTFTTDANGENLRQLTSGPSDITFGGWLNQGNQFVATVGTYPRGDLALYDSDGTYLRTLVSGGAATFFEVAPNQQQFVYGAAGYLYLFDLEGSTRARISNAECWGAEWCYLYGPTWSPSDAYLTFSTLNFNQPGQPDDIAAWIVSLTPTPQVPAGPFATDLSRLTWITDRFLGNGAILIDRENSVRRELFPPSDDVWWNHGWRHLP